MPTLRCPICDRPFELDESPAPPFCSRRCHRIDLGRWLGEEYGLPYERDEDSPEGDSGDRSPD
jgi:hypothetical protein